MCVLIYSTNILWNFLIRRIVELDIIINVHRPSCEVRVIFVRF